MYTLIFLLDLATSLPKWKMEGSYSLDLTGGLSAAFNTLLMGKYRLVAVDANGANYKGSHLHAEDLPLESIGDINVPEGKFGWAIRNNLDLYDIYVFSTAEFVQGFIAACNSLRVDFRDYIAGTPFQTIYSPHVHNLPYIIEGYEIDQSPLIKSPQTLQTQE